MIICKVILFRNFGGRVNFYCEFPGSENFALKSKIEATNWYAKDENLNPSKAIDNDWEENKDIASTQFQSSIFQNYCLKLC